ncbi:MAG TPA: hypothetical protein VEA80_11320 [Vitreimonas sp.]|uniref:hypothetical protein n=1 Tax=Vitreimonas sp. TaxID=3069702 RepID=UPI002D325E8E|nr:hypothetical protein [Vitreimonas sp.]HYD88057.1 hypothetical protein [Vitreimonas sp.]
MIIRVIVLGLCLAAASVPAQAQQTVHVPAAEAAAPEETASALRDVYQALFFDSGMFDAMAEHYLPIYRQTITSSDLYRLGGERRRADLDALIARTPELMRDEVIAEADTMSSNIAPEISALFTPEELRDYADLIRLPLWQRHIQAMAQQAAENNGDPHDYQPVFTAEERAELEAMEQRPGAQALMRSGGALNAILHREMQAAGPRMQARLQQRLASEFCNLLGNDCPPALRASIRPT